MARGAGGVSTNARFAAIAAIAWALGGCRSSHAGTSGPAPADAAVDAGDAATAAAVPEAGSPDDTIPPASSEELTTRARHLVEAIAKDDASLAADILFPRDAWLATRDAADPGKDWEKRVERPFHRSLHVFSRRIKGLERAQAITLELGHSMTQATPRKHGWKTLLWTVTGSRLTFTVDGRTRTLPIREMVAWRGAWYVASLR